MGTSIIYKTYRDKKSGLKSNNKNIHDKITRIKSD